MAVVSGSITVNGGAGSGTVVTLSGNDYVSLHASMFQSMATQVFSSGSGFYNGAGSAALQVVPDGAGNVGVLGGASSSTVVAGDGSTLAFFGSSNATVVAGNGNDTVLAGAGNDTIALGAGNNQIVLGAGNSLVQSGGTDVVDAGSGADTVSVSGVSSSIYGGYGGSLLVDDSAGTNTQIFATSGTVIDGSNSSITTVHAFGSTTIYGGTGGLSIDQAQGGVIVNGNLGGTIHVTASSAAQADALYAGSAASIYLSGSTNGNQLVANDVRHSDGNNVLLSGADAIGNNVFWAGSGNATLIGGTGQDTLVAGSGHATMTGGTGGANNFDFFANQGGSTTHVTIVDFGAVSGNQIGLFGYGPGGVQAALGSATQQGTSTVLTLGDGTSITLENVQKSSLTAHSFVASPAV